ncbi:MAG: hypothetical protein V3V20_09250 [Algisphaera sp.]
MDDQPKRTRQDAEADPLPAGTSAGDVSTTPSSLFAQPVATHRVMVVVGAHLRAEEADRPLAYRLIQAIEHWIERHRDLLEVKIVPAVCSDLWYLSHDDLRRLPTVCIGGPGVNTLSAYLAQHLVEEDRGAEVLLQIDPEFTDLQACVWGMNHELTAHGVELFMKQYLDGYLRAVATQIEP